VDRPDPNREAYVNYLARCDQAFNPHAPIDLPEFFAGRRRHIERLQGEIAAPGRQVAIFGERGVGKTSLAQLAYFFLAQAEEHTHFVRCERTSTFDSIFADVLANAGVEVILNGTETDAERRGRLGAAGFSVGGSRRVRQTFRRISAGRQISPRLLLDQFAERDGLIIIDEFDRVTDADTHTRTAELLKQFSDARCQTKVILVGVAETVTQLVGEHESLSRSLAQIKLDRMSSDELCQIIANAEEHLALTVKTALKHRVVRLADGFPYFVHLIGRHAARAAGQELLSNATASLVVGESEYTTGLNDALENAEHTLAEQYSAATVTTRRPSEKFQLVLWALALAGEREVQVREIASQAAFFTQQEYSPSAFNYHLGELTKEDRGQILTKVREGWYKFANPLMRPYVRLQLELENVLVHGSQLEFPFMR
jgi:Cdc6-like AAA superfamily ATPase